MANLLDGAGRPVVLGERLGGGGEGEVYAVRGSMTVAKVHVPRVRTRETHDKIRTMIDRPPPGAHERVDGLPILAWPTGLLFEGRVHPKRFLGYTMPRVEVQRDFVPFYQVSSLSRRQQLGGSGLTFDRLLLLGLRITHVVRTLHRMRYAVGDLNDRNILVSRRLTPLFLDADSFEVPRGFLGHYPCRVGDRLYWPPELLGVDLGDHRHSRVLGDRYALAVLLFQLFLNGMRPYQARGRLVAHLETLEQKARAGFFPWAQPKRGQLEPPSGAPNYGALPRSIRRAFEAAFVQGHMKPRRRPSAEDWYQVLRRVHDEGFATCAAQPLHRYARLEQRCPWCADPHDPFGASRPRRRRRPWAPFARAA